MNQKKAMPRRANCDGIWVWITDHAQIIARDEAHKAGLWLGIMFGSTFGICLVHSVLTAVI